MIIHTARLGGPRPGEAQRHGRASRESRGAWGTRPLCREPSGPERGQRGETAPPAVWTPAAACWGQRTGQGEEEAGVG